MEERCRRFLRDHLRDCALAGAHRIDASQQQSVVPTDCPSREHNHLDQERSLSFVSTSNLVLRARHLLRRLDRRPLSLEDVFMNFLEETEQYRRTWQSRGA